MKNTSSFQGLDLAAILLTTAGNAYPDTTTLKIGVPVSTPPPRSDREEWRASATWGDTAVWAHSGESSNFFGRGCIT